MYHTLEKNKTKEFKAYFDELHDIFKSAIKLWEDHDHKGAQIPESKIQKLQKRIDKLAARTYEEKDCKRYTKRLRREGQFLLTFLKHDDVPYHNNTSERALRIFALMRKITYGSRSRRGIKTTEILATVYATCEMRGVNPCEFMIDYLNGRIRSIPLPEYKTMGAIVAT